MAQTLNTVWYANYGNGSSTGYYAVSAWQANHNYSTVGTIIRQNATPTQGNERCFISTTTGTSAPVTEPTWTITIRGKTTDNSAINWYECSGNPALNGDVTNTPASSTERSQAITTGVIIKNNGATHFFICTTAGTAGAGEPSYNTTTGATTADNTVTWTCIGAVSTFSTAWGAPAARVSNAMNNGASSGGTIYVSASSAESQSGLITGTSGAAGFISQILCVSNTPSLPPVVGDLTTGASVASTSTSIISWGGFIYVSGLTFNNGANSQTMTFNQTGICHFNNCAFTLTGTGSQGVSFGNTHTKIILENSTIQLNGSASAVITLTGGHFVWKNTASAISKGSSGGSSWPSGLFNSSTMGTGDQLIENVDLSAFGGTSFFGSNSVGGRLVFKDCKVPNITLGPPTNGQGGAQADFINCDNGGNIYNHSRWWYEGQHTVSTTAVRTGGASDGTTAYSWQVATVANTVWVAPFECMPICIWNTIITPSSTTVTIEAAYVGTALPYNDDIWIDVNYYGTSSSTLGTCQTTTKSSLLATNTQWSSSSALWGGSAAARQANHAYSVGDMIGVSSASSIVRLFYCTTAGTSFNGAAPGAYASATDGTQVTDGTAVFTAVERFQLTTTLSSPKIQSAGTITVYVYAAKASATFFVDPVITLS